MRIVCLHGSYFRKGKGTTKDSLQLEHQQPFPAAVSKEWFATQVSAGNLYRSGRRSFGTPRLSHQETSTIRITQRWNRRVRINIVTLFVFSSHPLVPEQNPKNATSEAPEALSGFAPLKSLLEFISTVYANQRVSPRLPPLYPALANHTAGTRRHPEPYRIAPLTCNQAGETF